MTTTLFTVTEMGVEEPMFPAASYAFVVRVCDPLDAVVVFQLQVYGEVVSVVWSVPSR